MNKLEIELEDDIIENLEVYCKETGFTKEILLKVILIGISKNKSFPFINEVSNDIRNEACNLDESYFDFENNLNPSAMVKNLSIEHPYVIACILSYISHENAAKILENLPEKKQIETAEFIAQGVCENSVFKSAILKYAKDLSNGCTECIESDGYSILAQIVSLFENDAASLLEKLNPELQQEIKDRMFLFKDIVFLDDRSFQKVLREADAPDITKALMISSKDVADKVFRNMSKKAAAMIIEDMEFMGPIRFKDSFEAQVKIIEIIRRLERKGEIIINANENLVQYPSWLKEYENAYENGSYEEDDTVEEELSD